MGNALHLERRACHNIMYTVVNSRAYAGELDTGMETGRKAMITIDVVGGAVLVCAEILLMRNCCKKNVQEKISPGEMRSPQPCDRLHQGLAVPDFRHCQALIFDVYFLERGRDSGGRDPFLPTGGTRETPGKDSRRRQGSVHLILRCITFAKVVGLPLKIRRKLGILVTNQQ